MFESEKQRYKDCKVNSPNAYACKSDSSSKAKYLSIQRRNKLFVVGLFFFAFVFFVSAMFIAPNKMTPQTTTPTPVNALNPSGSCGTNATYTLDSEGTLTISGTGAIADNAFKSQTDAGIVNVVIGDGITSIGNFAFSSCSSLTSVTIPDSVTSIGLAAFADCSGLKTIEVNSGNAVYDSRGNCNAIIETGSNTLIAGCKNTTIPNSVETIGDSAFASCSSLTSITIPDGVTSIGDYAFLQCSGLTSITIPDEVTSISSLAFFYCSADLIICGSGNKESVAYNYAQSNQINYATAWVKKDSATHTRTFYGFKTDSNATEVTQIENHSFGADGMAETCSDCGAQNDNVIITLNVKTNVSRYFVIYVLDSDNQPTRQFVVTNGDKIVFTMAKSSTFTIQVYETLYMRAKIDDVDTLKQKYENLTEHKTIAIDISGVTNVYNWVMI